MADTTTLIQTQTVAVDINLLTKNEEASQAMEGKEGKEDSSQDTTAPASSCDTSHDGGSVNDSLGPPSPLPDPAPLKTRTVSFSNIEIREYPRCLGDHPGVSEGPPLTLGWNHTQQYTKKLEEYEKQRDEEIVMLTAAKALKAAEEKIKRGEVPDPIPPSPKGRRRASYEYNIPCRERIKILQEECSSKSEEAKAAGTVCTGLEIKQVIREIQKTKQQRRSSHAMVEFEGLQLKVEGCQRKMKKMLGIRKKDSLTGLVMDGTSKAESTKTDTDSPRPLGRRWSQGAGKASPDSTNSESPKPPSRRWSLPLQVLKKQGDSSKSLASEDGSGSPTSEDNVNASGEKGSFSWVVSKKSSIKAPKEDDVYV